MATLTSLPDELLAAIFSDVAADVSAGHITTTVGPVCKLFHNLIQSSGIDVHYVFLLGVDSMRAFLAVILSRKMAQRRVHSLLIVADHDHRHSRENPTSDASLVRTLQAIIVNINPSLLHTLFMYSFSNNQDENLTLHIPISLPALTTLCLSGFVVTSSSPLSSLQSIQLLRLASLDEEYRNVPRLVVTLAPHATRLKLTFRTCAGAVATQPVGYLNEFLRATLLRKTGRTIPQFKNFPQSHAFPDSLTQIVLHCPNPELEDAHWGLMFTRSLQVVLMRAWRLLAEPLVLLSFTDEESEGEKQHVEELVEEWMQMNCDSKMM
ncbi:hypothetical protein EIP91_001695 [Steccherinum ochraceum]|uniref:F-box domain-containing protein n=1 Tax=Steccherinum ochraceum TaxID=92696 RepID=A0A4R0RDH6_9APHY|nr:hypothetical protein EIP91_001695 [Steccherinum ochraceum]